MRCWRRTEKIICIGHGKKEVLNKFKEQENTLHKNKVKEGYLDWSYLAWEMPSKSRY